MVGRWGSHYIRRKTDALLMLVQAREFFVRNSLSILARRRQTSNFRSSCLSCSAQHRGADAAFLRRPVPPPSGGALPAGFARPCSRIIAPWHSPASMLLERTPQRANCHLTRACACCLQEFPRVASAQWVPVEHWTCGGSLALPSCSVDLRILAHVGLRRRLSCVLASFDTHF